MTITVKYLSIACLFLLAGLIVSVQWGNSQKNEKKAISFNVQHEHDTLVTLHDLFSTEHKERLAIQGELKDLQVSYKGDLDQAAKRAQIDRRQIEHLSNLVISAQGTITAPVDTVHHHDTVDRWHSVDSFAVFKGMKVKNTEVVTYNIRVPANLTAYWKRAHSFIGIDYGNIQHYINAYSLNPNAHIDSLQDIRILQKDPGRWGIGPYFGYGFNGANLQPSFGISIHYDLIRW